MSTIQIHMHESWPIMQSSKTSTTHIIMYQSKINTIQVDFQPSLEYHTLNLSKVFKVEVFTLNDL